MTSHNDSQPNAAAKPVAGVGMEDMVSTLRRRKWVLLVCLVLGIIGAVVAVVFDPPLYSSQAKLLLHYAAETKQSRTKEVEILTSLDIANEVVAMVGADRILAKNGKGRNPLDAAAVVSRGTEVSRSNNPVLILSFRNRDRSISQPVLEATLHAYMRKHLELYTDPGNFGGYGLKDLEKRLAQTDEELKKAKAEAGLSQEGASEPFELRIARAQQDLNLAARELAERWGTLGVEQKLQILQQSNAGADIPPGAAVDYAECCRELEKLKNQERELISKGFTETHPLVQTIRGQLRNLSAQRAELEKEVPALKQLAFVENSKRGRANTVNVAPQLAEIKRLTARVSTLTTNLNDLQAQAARSAELRPQIAALERRRTELMHDYDSALTQSAKAMSRLNAKDDDVVGISIVQNPSPPVLEFKETCVLAGLVLAAGFALGVGLSVLSDRVLDRSIKGPMDVERHLRIPLFLAIPDTSPLRLSVPGGSSGESDEEFTEPQVTAGWAETDGGEPLRSDQNAELGVYAAGLRERVWSYFEFRELDLKKPKLVAVTGCGRGVGVSTVARGLAAELSRAGEGNVLLVDVSGENRSARSFSTRHSSFDMSEALEPGSRAGSRVQDRLYLARLDEAARTDLSMLLVKRFKYFVPKLKASDYDYIVFDLPPVSPTSPTPRLASHMDLTLLVLESERTERKLAILANERMQEAHAHIAAVLNKCHRRVPITATGDC